MDLENAFDILSPRIFAYLRRLGLNIDDSEDGVQEVFLRAMKSRIDWDKPSSYLFKIAHNYAMDLLRKPKTDPLENIEPIAMDYYEDDFLAPLSKEEKSILLMLYQEEMSYDDISKICEKPIGTLKSIVYRAKEKIKDRS